MSCQPELEDCPEAELNNKECEAMTYYNEAIYHREHKNWPDYVYNLLQACELGNPKAGKEYYKLNNLTDYNGMLEMMQEALDKNPQNSYFITFLGYMYKHGKGVVQNVTKAEELYLRGIEYKNTIAICNLAYFYRQAKKYDLALELYEQADRLKDIDAPWSLGEMYFMGQGVSQDYIKAKKYYKKSIKRGSYRAKNSLGYMYLMGRGAKRNYNKALALFESSSKHGYFTATNNLAFMYQWGYGVVQDYEKARTMYESVAENVPTAICNLGFMYLKGQGIPVSFSKAQELFEKAVERKNADAAQYLALIYRQGLGVTVDENKALEYDKLYEDYKKN